MATKLPFPPIADFHNPSVKLAETHQRVPLCALPQLSFPPVSYFSANFSSCKEASLSPALPRAIKQEVIQYPSSESTGDSDVSSSTSSKFVLVIGGSGGVGQLVVASLLERNIKSRLLIRKIEKATSLFGKQDEGRLEVVIEFCIIEGIFICVENEMTKEEVKVKMGNYCSEVTDLVKRVSRGIFDAEVVKGDTRNPEDLNPSIFEGITHVICCTGTTAFPSKRWDGDNTPEKTGSSLKNLDLKALQIVDWEGVRNLISVIPPSVRRVVLVSSIGVTKCNELPWSIMNLFGVLKYKKKGEDFLRDSGLPFTIIRAGRLTDGPYTSYDLNTLLQATAGRRKAVLIGQGDKLVGEASRLVVAEACIQALDIDVTAGEIYEINSIEGDGPGSDTKKWTELFEAVKAK